MANYNYECNICKAESHKLHADELTADGSGVVRLPPNLYEELVLFETSHPMKPTKEELYNATECPRCGSHDCEMTFYDVAVHSYTKGYGWLDKKGVSRDRNRYTLKNDDPYGQYRESGEVAHIDSQLKKEGQHNPKTRHYLAGDGVKGMEQAVEKATSTPSPPSNE